MLFIYFHRKHYQLHTSYFLIYIYSIIINILADNSEMETAFEEDIEAALAET